MRNSTLTISDEELLNLTRTYLERQFTEWLELRKNVAISPIKEKDRNFSQRIHNFIPYLIGICTSYVNSNLNEAEFREKFACAVRLYLVDEKLPYRNLKEKRQVYLTMLRYLSNIYFAHGHQQELQRIFQAAIDLPRKYEFPPSKIFKRNSIYLIFLKKTETAISFRKKLERILGTELVFIHNNEYLKIRGIIRDAINQRILKVFYPSPR